MAVEVKKSWLDTTHPAYEASIAQWRLNIDSYIGGAQYDAGGHLFQYSRNESDGAYNDRKARSARRNITKRIVDTFVGHISKGQVSRSPNVPEPVIAFRKSPTKDGGEESTISTFMDEVATWAKVCGRIAVVVDQADVQVLTKLDEQIAGVRPYAYIVTPDDVLDFAFDKQDGRLLWIKLREWSREDSDPMTASSKVSARYRIWFRDRWELWRKEEEKGEVKEVLDAKGLNELRDRHGRGVVPVALVDYEKGSSPWVGSTDVDDIARLDRNVYNVESELDEIACRYTFSQLWMKINNATANQVIQAATKVNPSLQPDQALLQYAVNVGKSEFFLSVTEDSGPGAGFISPDASQGELLVKIIDQKQRAIYNVAAMQDETAEVKGAAQSGESKKREFARLDSALRRFAKRLENAEWMISQFALYWSGSTETLPEDACKWPDSFDVSALIDDLNEATSIDAFLADSPTARLLIRRRIARKAFAENDDEAQLLVKIEKEIEAAIANPAESLTDDDQEEPPGPESEDDGQGEG